MSSGISKEDQITNVDTVKPALGSSNGRCSGSSSDSKETTVLNSWAQVVRTATGDPIGGRVLIDSEKSPAGIRLSSEVSMRPCRPTNTGSWFEHQKSVSTCPRLGPKSEGEVQQTYGGGG